MATEKRCGTCKYWVGERGKNGRPLDRAGKCAAPVPPAPELPGAYLFRFQWPPAAHAAWPDDVWPNARGVDCKLWDPA